MTPGRAATLAGLRLFLHHLYLSADGFLGQTHAHQYYPTNIWRNEAPWALPGNLNGGRKQYVHDLFTRGAANFIRINQPTPTTNSLPSCPSAHE